MRFCLPLKSFSTPGSLPSMTIKAPPSNRAHDTGCSEMVVIQFPVLGYPIITDILDLFYRYS